jgi:hypothetical protein
MPQQYIRHVEVRPEGGDRTYASDGDTGLRTRFQVNQAIAGSPPTAVIMLTNINTETKNKFQKEFKKVSLFAGYRDGGKAQLFSGSIIQARVFREDVTDTVLQITARGQENEARNFAVVNKALASGHTVNDRVQVAVDAFKKMGVQAGTINSLGKYKFPRNYIAHGMAHDLLREICRGSQANWWIADNKLHVLKSNETLPGNIIVLNADTGLIGIPEQTIEGVQFTCLMNYEVKAGAKVKIDNRSITQAQFSANPTAEPANQLYLDPNTLGLSADGIYKVLKVVHTGDTRGNEFYSHGWCVALGADNKALRAQGVYTDMVQDVPTGLPYNQG